MHPALVARILASDSRHEDGGAGARLEGGGGRARREDGEEGREDTRVAGGDARRNGRRADVALRHDATTHERRDGCISVDAHAGPDEAPVLRTPAGQEGHGADDEENSGVKRLSEEEEEGARREDTPGVDLRPNGRHADVPALLEALAADPVCGICKTVKAIYVAHVRQSRPDVAHVRQSRR